MNKTKKLLSLVVAIIFLINTIGVSGVSFAEPVNQPETLDVSIPQEYALISDIYSGGTEGTVFLIQDAHTSLEAQYNIAHTIDYLIKENGIPLICVEGYAGELGTKIDDAFNSTVVSKETNMKVADFLMKNGEMNGSQYAYLFRKRSAQLIGVENQHDYRKNLRQFHDVLQNNQVLLEEIQAMQTIIDQLKSLVYQPVILTIEQSEQLFKNTNMITDYLSCLYSSALSAGINISGYKNINTLLKKQESSNIANIDFAGLLHELDELSTAIKEHYLKKGDAYVLFQIDELFQKLPKMLSASMSKKEFDEFYKYKQEFLVQLKFDCEWLAAKASQHAIHFDVISDKKVLEALEEVNKFYRLASYRDKHFVKNTWRRMQQTKAQNAILVAGGFHSEGLQYYLKEMNLSYAVITPKITSLQDDLKAVYYKKAAGIKSDHTVEVLFNFVAALIEIEKLFTRDDIPEIDRKQFIAILQALYSNDIETARQLLNALRDEYPEQFHYYLKHKDGVHKLYLLNNLIPLRAENPRAVNVLMQKDGSLTLEWMPRQRPERLTPLEFIRKDENFAFAAEWILKYSGLGDETKRERLYQVLEYLRDHGEDSHEFVEETFRQFDVLQEIHQAYYAATREEVIDINLPSCQGRHALIADYIKGPVICDLGAGNMLLGERILKHHPDVTQCIAVDVEKQRDEEIRPYPKGLSFRLMDEPNVIPLEDNSVDTIILTFVLHHVDYDMGEYLKEVRRILKPGGRVVIIEDTFSNFLNVDPFLFDADDDFDNRFSEWFEYLLSDKDRLGFLHFADWFVHNFVNRSREALVPGNYHSIEDWISFFEGTGFTVQQVRNLGFTRLASRNPVSRGLFVLENPMKDTPQALAQAHEEGHIENSSFNHGLSQVGAYANSRRLLLNVIRDSEQNHFGITFSKGDIPYEVFKEMIAAYPADYEVLVLLPDGTTKHASLITTDEYESIRTRLSDKALYERYKDTAYVYNSKNPEKAGFIVEPIREDQDTMDWLVEQFFPGQTRAWVQHLFEDMEYTEWLSALTMYVTEYQDVLKPHINASIVPNLITEENQLSDELLNAYRQVARGYYAFMAFQSPAIPFVIVKKTDRSNYAILQEMIAENERIDLERGAAEYTDIRMLVYTYLYEKLQEDLSYEFHSSPEDNVLAFEQELETILNDLNGQDALKFILISSTFPLNAIGPRKVFALSMENDARYKQWNDICYGPMSGDDWTRAFQGINAKKQLVVFGLINGMHCSSHMEVEADVLYGLPMLREGLLSEIQEHRFADDSLSGIWQREGATIPRDTELVILDWDFTISAFERAVAMMATQLIATGELTDDYSTVAEQYPDIFESAMDNITPELMWPLTADNMKRIFDSIPEDKRGTLTVDAVETFIKEQFQRSRQEHDPRVMPGGVELIQGLQERGMAIAIVTNNLSRAIIEQAEWLGIDLTDITVHSIADRVNGLSGQPVDLSWNKMHAFKQVMRENGVSDPTHVVSIDDSMSAIAVAKEIGCISVAVGTGQYKRDALRAREPDFQVDTLETENLIDLIAGTNISYKASEFAKDTVAKLTITSGTKVLSLGTGQGQDEILFASKGAEVTAIDTKDQGLPDVIDLHMGDILDVLPTLEGQYDVIYARLVLHYFSKQELEVIFEHLNRLLAPGGHICFVVKSQNDWHYKRSISEEGLKEDEATWKLTYIDPEDRKEYTRQFFDTARVEYYLAQQGFTIVGDINEVSTLIMKTASDFTQADGHESSVLQVIAQKPEAVAGYNVALSCQRRTEQLSNIERDIQKSKQRTLFDKVKEILNQKPANKKSKVNFVCKGRYHRSSAMQIAAIDSLERLGKDDRLIISSFGMLPFNEVQQFLPDAEEGVANPELVEAAEIMGIRTEGLPSYEGTLEDDVSNAELFIVATEAYKQELIDKYGPYVENKMITLGEFFEALTDEERNAIIQELKEELPEEQFGYINFDELVHNIPDPMDGRLSHLSMFILIQKIIDNAVVPMLLAYDEEQTPTVLSGRTVIADSEIEDLQEDDHRALRVILECSELTAVSNEVLDALDKFFSPFKQGVVQEIPAITLVVTGKIDRTVKERIEERLGSKVAIVPASGNEFQNIAEGIMREHEQDQFFVVVADNKLDFGRRSNVRVDVKRQELIGVVEDLAHILIAFLDKDASLMNAVMTLDGNISTFVTSVLSEWTQELDRIRKEHVIKIAA